MNRFAAFAISFMVSCTPIQQNALPSRAASFDTTLSPMKTFAAGTVAPPARSNTEMAQDFLDLTFNMESGLAIPVMTRFEGPITVRISGTPVPSLQRDLELLLVRLRNEAGIDISLTTAEQANITVEAIPGDTLQRAVPSAACFVVPRIASWADFKIARHTPQIDWTTLSRRDRAVIFIPANVAPQEIRDCLHEELAQALGPLNDLYRLPDSVFNDDNIHTVLTGFDMLMLRSYYAPELRNGMSRHEAAVRLPALLSRLNPAGDRTRKQTENDTSRDWLDAIALASANEIPLGVRRQAAEKAITLGRTFGWTGPRTGYAYYIYGRLQGAKDSDIALASFNQAERTYRASPLTQIHAAHMVPQQAAFSLSAGDAELTLQLVNSAIPVAQTHQNAILLATLMMLQAEALDMQGNSAQAAAVRLDSLGWARYGFGADRNVQARLNEIRALRPD